jgi:hypothetical protein
MTYPPHILARIEAEQARAAAKDRAEADRLEAALLAEATTKQASHQPATRQGEDIFTKTGPQLRKLERKRRQAARARRRKGIKPRQDLIQQLDYIEALNSAKVIPYERLDLHGIPTLIPPTISRVK